MQMLIRGCYFKLADISSDHVISLDRPLKILLVENISNWAVIALHQIGHSETTPVDPTL